MATKLAELVHGTKITIQEFDSLGLCGDWSECKRVPLAALHGWLVGKFGAAHVTRFVGTDAGKHGFMVTAKGTDKYYTMVAEQADYYYIGA